MELVALGLSPKISRPTELDHISQGERFFWATDLWRAWEATPRLHPALNFLFMPWSRQKQLPKKSAFQRVIFPPGGTHRLGIIVTKAGEL